MEVSAPQDTNITVLLLIVKSCSKTYRTWRHTFFFYLPPYRDSAI